MNRQSNRISTRLVDEDLDFSSNPLEDIKEVT